MTRETELDVIEDEDVRIAVRALGQMRSGNGGQQKRAFPTFFIFKNMARWLTYMYICSVCIPAELKLE